MSIKDWPAEERPRERLLRFGAAALSDSELLAIFLRTGVKGMSAVDLSRMAIHHFGGLGALLHASQQEFCQCPGLGGAKFVQLQAVLEMARRHQNEQMVREDALTSPELVRSYLRARLRSAKREVFAVLFLDSQNRLIRYQEMFYGTIDSAAVYPREVVKAALDHHAAACILAHNHPSGLVEPSQADIHITDKIKRALDLVDIRLLDHFIVGDREPLSFAERGLI